MTEKNEKEKIKNSEELIRLVKNNNLKEVFDLLSKPIDFDEKILQNPYEDSVFHIAIRNGNIKMFDYLYKSFPNLLSKVVNNRIILGNGDKIIRKSILQIFAEMGNLRLVNLLLSMDNIDYNREDLINYLIKGRINKFEIKEIINEYGIADEIDQKIIDTILDLNNEYNYYTIFNYVINNDDIKGLRFLLKFYKNIEIYTNIIAITKQKGKNIILKNLIDDFAFQSINEKDENGNTLLHYAVLKCDLETIVYLIRKGAKPDIENNCGLNPLGMLLNSNNFNQYYYKEIVNLLLNKNLLENIRNFQLYQDIVENERRERELGLTEISRDQDILNVVEDLNNQQQNSEENQNLNKEKNYIKKQITNSMKSSNNISNLASLYGQCLIYCMNNYIDYLNYDYTLDPIWKYFNNIDKAIESLKEPEKIIEEIYKLTRTYRSEIVKTLKSLNDEDFDICKAMFSMNKVKEKMNKVSNNLYKEIIGDLIEKTIIDVEYSKKIENLFPIKNSLEIDADVLMELIPFNKNDEVDKEKLPNIVNIAKNILPKNKFDELSKILERNFWYKVIKDVDKNFYEGFDIEL